MIRQVPGAGLTTERNSQAVQPETLDDLRDLLEPLPVQSFHAALHFHLVQLIFVRINFRA